MNIRFIPGETSSLQSLPDGLVSLNFIPAMGGISRRSDLLDEVRLRVRLENDETLRGDFTFSFGGESASLSSDREIPATAMERLLNSIEAIREAGLVTVRQVGAFAYDVRFRVNGARSAITLSEASLGSLSRVTQIQTGSASLPSIQRINLNIGELLRVENGDFTDIAAGDIAVTTVSSGDATQAQEEALSFGDLPPEAGSFTVSIDGAVTWSDPIPANPSAQRLQNALDDLDPYGFTVSRQSRGWYLIRRSRTGTATAIQADKGGLIWPQGVTCSLNWAVCLRIAERHLAASETNFVIELETSDDFSDAASPVRKSLTLFVPVAIRSAIPATVGDAG